MSFCQLLFGQWHMAHFSLEFLAVAQDPQDKCTRQLGRNIARNRADIRRTAQHIGHPLSSAVSRDVKLDPRREFWYSSPQRTIIGYSAHAPEKVIVPVVTLP